MERDMIALLSNVGFPVVAYLLMYRMVTSTLQENTKAIATMSQVLQELRSALERRGEG
jgi:hypothetical protein